TYGVPKQPYGDHPRHATRERDEGSQQQERAAHDHTEPLHALAGAVRWGSRARRLGVISHRRAHSQAMSSGRPAELARTHRVSALWHLRTPPTAAFSLRPL